MRKAFIETIVDLAADDPRIVLMTGDLGFTVVEPFADRFPERFYNVGVAEQNMVGLATGLAEAGFRPYLYSIATFAALRPFEFIRNGPVLHRLPVRIVGVGGGYEYGPAGHTHHAMEDVAVMRTQPGLAIAVPADHAQTRAAVRCTADLEGPVYLRLGKDDKTLVEGLGERFELGRLQHLRKGVDTTIIAMGPIAVAAQTAAEQLAERGVDAGVSVLASVAPPPRADIEELVANNRFIVTVEEHVRPGGMGSLVSEIVAEMGVGRVIRVNPEDGPAQLSGSEGYLRSTRGLAPEDIADAAWKLSEVI